MKFLVLRTFRDKHTKRVHQRGSAYETDRIERGQQLQALGYLGEVVPEPRASSDDDQAKLLDLEPGDVQGQETELEAQLKPVGGGYYELPNGERVRGKANALEALKGGDGLGSGESE